MNRLLIPARVCLPLRISESAGAAGCTGKAMIACGRACTSGGADAAERVTACLPRRRALLHRHRLLPGGSHMAIEVCNEAKARTVPRKVKPDGLKENSFIPIVKIEPPV